MDVGTAPCSHAVGLYALGLLQRSVGIFPHYHIALQLIDDIQMLSLVVEDGMPRTRTSRQALLGAKTTEQRIIAFPELGMEALHLIKVDKYPAIIGAAHGRSIYE